MSGPAVENADLAVRLFRAGLDWDMVATVTGYLDAPAARCMGLATVPFEDRGQWWWSESGLPVDGWERTQEEADQLWR